MSLPACREKSALENRPLLSTGRAGRLAGLFQVLAGVTRLRLLHALAKEPELSVSKLAARLRLKLPAVSNQLQHLAALGIIASRRAGVSIHYRLADPCVPALLDRGLCLMDDARPRRTRASRRTKA